MKWNDIPTKCGGIFLPFTLLSLSLIIHLNWQFKCISDMQDTLHTAIEAQDAPLANATASEDKVEHLVNDLLQLADSGDPAAIAIARKHKVAHRAPAPSNQ